MLNLNAATSSKNTLCQHLRKKFIFTQQLISKCDNVKSELKQEGYLCSVLAQSTQHKENTFQKYIYLYHILISYNTHCTCSFHKTFWDPNSLIHYNDGLIVNRLPKQNGLVELHQWPQVCLKQIYNTLTTPFIDIFRYICLWVTSSYMLPLMKPWCQAAKWLLVKK